LLSKPYLIEVQLF